MDSNQCQLQDNRNHDTNFIQSKSQNKFNANLKDNTYLEQSNTDPTHTNIKQIPNHTLKEKKDELTTPNKNYSGQKFDR